MVKANLTHFGADTSLWTPRNNGDKTKDAI